MRAKCAVPFTVFCVAGIFAGFAPSALTFGGIPHALRSAGVVPFVALLTGLALWRLNQAWRGAVVLTLAVSVSFAGYWLPYYFGSYPAASWIHWDSIVVSNAEQARVTGDWRSFVASANEYADASLR